MPTRSRACGFHLGFGLVATVVIRGVDWRVRSCSMTAGLQGHRVGRGPHDASCDAPCARFDGQPAWLVPTNLTGPPPRRRPATYTAMEPAISRPVGPRAYSPIR